MSEYEYREENLQLKERIAALKSSADEATYQTKSSQSVILLAGELLGKYSQELIDDGMISHLEQLSIFKKIKAVSSIIIDAVNDASLIVKKT